MLGNIRALGGYVGISAVLVYGRRFQRSCAVAVRGLVVINGLKERSGSGIEVIPRIEPCLRLALLRRCVGKRNIILGRCAVDMQVIDCRFALVVNDKAGRDHLLGTVDVDNHHRLTRALPVIHEGYGVIIR